MKSALGASLLAILLAVSGANRSFGQGEPSDGGGYAQTQSWSLAVRLAAQVRSISDSALMSHAKKEAHISTAVRVAVIAATVYQKDPATVVGITIQLASAAAQAAPTFADSIARAASFAPTVARVGGAGGQIRGAVAAAARGDRRRGPPARSRSMPPPELAESGPLLEPRPAPAPERAASVPPAGDSMPPSSDLPPAYAATESGTMPLPASESNAANLDETSAPRRSQININGNTNAHVTLDLSAQYNDNVFLSNANKVADTLLSVTPGADVGYGQNSLSHGSLSVQEALVKYVHNSSPSANLANVAGNLGFENDNLKAAATGAYQQLYQNNSQIVTLGQHTLLRTDTTSANGSVEPQLTPKISSSVGAGFSQTAYKNSTLVGERNLGIPVSFYYKATPVVDLSAGFTYGTATPTGTGPQGKDFYYNVGARGAFTPKLTGNFTVGYRRQTVQGSPAESLWGFDGKFNYQATDKTTASLDLSRGFDISALGQSDQNSSYALVLKTVFTPQFSVSLNGAYQRVSYGAPIFATTATSSLATARQDSYWSGGLLASYTFTSWLTAVANYTGRSNHSSLPLAAFDDNLLSLTLGFQY